LAAAAVRAHSRASGVQMASLELLWRLIDGTSDVHHEYNELINNAGGEELAQAAINAFPGNGMVQADACLLLMSMVRHMASDELVAESAMLEIVRALMLGEGVEERCSDKRGRIEYVTDCIVKAGGVALAKALLRLHSGGAAVQHAGFQLLRSLINGAPEAQQEERRAAIACADGVELAEAAMRAHEANAAVQADCCALLIDLSIGPELRKNHVMKTDVVELAMAAMRAHAEDANMQSSACLLLTQLTQGSERRAAAVAGFGAVELASAALRAHPRHGGVQAHGCRLLTDLGARSRDRAAEVAASGGRQLAMMAMRAHMGNRLVQEAAAFLMASMNDAGGAMVSGPQRTVGAPPTAAEGIARMTPARYDIDQDGRLIH